MIKFDCGCCRRCLQQIQRLDAINHWLLHTQIGLWFEIDMFRAHSDVVIENWLREWVELGCCRHGLWFCMKTMNRMRDGQCTNDKQNCEFNETRCIQNILSEELKRRKRNQCTKNHCFCAEKHFKKIIFVGFCCYFRSSDNHVYHSRWEITWHCYKAEERKQYCVWNLEWKQTQTDGQTEQIDCYRKFHQTNLAPQTQLNILE